MKTIILYGDMREKFGREFMLDVKSPAEAIRALSAQVKGFRTYLHQHAQDAFKIFVGGRNVSDEFKNPCSDREVIRIAPTIQGAGAVGRIVLGVVLIVVGGLISGWTFGAGSGIGGPMMMMGMSLVLGGVVELLSPTAKTNSGTTGEDVTNLPSYNFSGAVNTEAQGHPVSLAYGGPIMAGSAVISAGLIL